MAVKRKPNIKALARKESARHSQGFLQAFIQMQRGQLSAQAKKDIVSALAFFGATPKEISALKKKLESTSSHKAVKWLLERDAFLLAQDHYIKYLFRIEDPAARKYRGRYLEQRIQRLIADLGSKANVLGKENIRNYVWHCLYTGTPIDKLLLERKGFGRKEFEEKINELTARSSAEANTKVLREMLAKNKAYSEGVSRHALQQLLLARPGINSKEIELVSKNVNGTFLCIYNEFEKGLVRAFRLTTPDPKHKFKDTFKLVKNIKTHRIVARELRKELKKDKE